MRLRLPRRRVWRVAIYGVSVLLVLTAGDMVLVQSRRSIRPGYDTTRLMMPRLADGRIDYLPALEEPRSTGVTPANNAAVGFVRAVGPAGLPLKQAPEVVTERLGIAPLAATGEYLVGFAEYCKQRGMVAPADDAPVRMIAAWPPAVTPALRGWIEANKQPLDVLVEASHKPRFYLPLCAGPRPELLMELYLTHVNALKEVGPMLLARGMMRVNAGDAEGVNDLLAVHLWARLVAQSSTMIEHLVAQQAFEMPALRSDRLVVNSGKLTAEQMKAFAEQLDAVGDMPGIERFLEGERMLTLDLTQGLRRTPGRFQEVFEDPAHPATKLPRICFAFIPFPWERNMRALNHAYDGAVAALVHEPYARRKGALDLWERQINSEKEGNPVWLGLSLTWSPDFYVTMLMFDVPKASRERDTCMEQRRLTETSVALARFKAERGQYPEGLASLVPAYLREVSMDVFSEAAPRYERLGNGYRLYSVGPDMRDDSGAGDDVSAVVEEGN